MSLKGIFFKEKKHIKNIEWIRSKEKNRYFVGRKKLRKKWDYYKNTDEGGIKLDDKLDFSYVTIKISKNYKKKLEILAIEESLKKGEFIEKHLKLPEIKIPKV